jgi:hypothetical protein
MLMRHDARSITRRFVAMSGAFAALQPALQEAEGPNPRAIGALRPAENG